MTVMPAAAPAIAPLLAPDLAAIKQRQQATWSSGDYHMIGTQILIVSELLIEALDVHSTERVLDVATGSGNAALAAARRGCEVVGVDYVPSLLDRARRRADAEGLPAEFVEGDAEALPFARRPVRRRQLRVRRDVRAGPGADRGRARPGHPARRPDRPRRPHARRLHRPAVQGRSARHVPPPAGVRSPIQWGTEERLRELFGDAHRRAPAAKRHYVFRYRSPEAYVDYWRRCYGPTLKAFEAVGDDGREALEADLLELDRPVQPGRRRHDGRPERVPRGGHRQAVAVARGGRRARTASGAGRAYPLGRRLISAAPRPCAA